MEPSLRDPSLEDNDFSETSKFISQIVMEENKSFYQALTGNIPIFPNQHPLLLLTPVGETTSNVMNAIACEGSERIERPETYKQWQVRNTRAGFKRLLLNEETWPNLGPEIRTGCFKVGRATFCTLPLVGRCYQTLFRAHTRLKGSILLSIIRSSNLGFGGAIKVGREG
ncbi:hypothetical protein JHK87_030829 [Glycine soja]|nr:hypothetical protein JHK87_030829 [Glycine soja]